MDKLILQLELCRQSSSIVEGNTSVDSFSKAHATKVDGCRVGRDKALLCDTLDRNVKVASLRYHLNGTSYILVHLHTYAPFINYGNSGQYRASSPGFPASTSLIAHESLGTRLVKSAQYLRFKSDNHVAG